MSCDAVRAALIDGHPTTPWADHVATCPACRVLVAAPPPSVEVARPTPDFARFRARARRETLTRAAIGAAALAAVALVWFQVTRPDTPDPALAAAGAASEAPHAAVADAASNDAPDAPDTGDVLGHPEQLAAFTVGTDLSDDPMEVDPLSDFEDPTDLLTTALLGQGSL